MSICRLSIPWMLRLGFSFHSVRIVLFCGYYWLQAPIRILLLFRFCDVPCELTTGAKVSCLSHIVADSLSLLHLFYQGICCAVCRSCLAESYISHLIILFSWIRTRLFSSKPLDSSDSISYSLYMYSRSYTMKPHGSAFQNDGSLWPHIPEGFLPVERWEINLTRELFENNLQLKHLRGCIASKPRQ